VFLNGNMSLIDYIKGSRAELKHVNWPTKKQAIGFTALVIAASLIVSLYLGLLDVLFNFLLKEIIS
jgi:preprotein translocase subunit SecE